MSFTQEEVVQKVAKLLRLATSDNPNEAALAAAKAQELMDRYEISKSMLEEGEQEKESDEPIVNFAEKGDPLEEGGKSEQWKNALGMIVAKFNGCRVYVEHAARYSKKLQIVGRPSDVQAVRYLYEYLKNEVVRLCRRDGKGCGKTWQTQFKLGVIDTIRTKLEEGRKATFASLRQEHGSNSTALVRVEKAIAKVEAKGMDVDQWMKRSLRLKTIKFSSRQDFSAREHGRVAGKEITINGARGAIGAGHKMIGSGN
jgi:hypothetical protein